ncbi:Peptidoglycan N-acetylglucosamine deacetylase [Acidisarcina polymorpha]|uniref:Peptidoglycan N-acetylglucosamine deacetylase n=1 Tax=Acidisarcina polymorpha TaxID=2211140 RepID=A0A2Z5FW27_9BACT|nr:polysaccharide deacetylase family protein [Acidisarcina polymorpha]AXC10962.1 Peptidoglycan N-acetylglucosamine deacetylase [Acidisarcina polymorpha]
MLTQLAATGAAMTLAAGGLAYASLSPGSQFFGQTVIATRNPNEVALTFDDGPNDPYTFQLLEMLAEHRVRATFFMIGRFVRQRPDIVRAVQAAGHLIGNHTMTHPWLVLESAARVRRELAECNAALEDVLGQKVHHFRPPHGARRPDVLRTACELGLTPVMWNVMGYDWKPENDASRILNYLEKGIDRNRRARRSSNIVLHDGGQAGIGQNRRATVEAVGKLLVRVGTHAAYIDANQISAKSNG